MAGVTRLALLIAKELADLRHQRTFVAVGTAAPFILFLVFYLIWATDVTFPMEVVNKAGRRGEAFIDKMEAIRTPYGTPYLHVERRNPTDTESRSPAEYLAVVEIPGNFERTQDGVREYYTIAHYGAVNENTIKNYINRLRMAGTEFWSGDLGFSPIRLKEAARYPHDIPTRQAMAVGLIAYAFLFSGWIFGGTLITREYEDRTIKLIQVAPANPVLVLASKGSVAMLLTLAAGAVYAVVTYFLTGAAPTAGAIFLVTALAIATIGVSLGMITGLLLRSSVPVFLVAIVTNLFMWIAGGGFGNLQLYSQAQQYVARILPYTHGMSVFWNSYYGSDPTPPPGSIIGLTTILLVSLLALYYTTTKIFQKGS